MVYYVYSKGNKKKEKDVLTMEKANTMTVLERLESLAPLTHEIELIVCTQDLNGATIETEKVEEAKNFIKKRFSTLFGGYTAIDAEGGWVLPEGTLVKESNTLIQASVSEKDFNDANLSLIISFAEGLKKTLHQDMVSMKLDGKRYFI